MNPDPEQPMLTLWGLSVQHLKLSLPLISFLIFKDSKLYFPIRLIVFSKALSLQFPSVLRSTVKSLISLKHTVICSKLRLKMTKMLWHINELHASCTRTLPRLCLSLYFQNMSGGLILWPRQYPDNACPLHPCVIPGFADVSPHSFRKVESWYAFSLYFRILSCFKKHRPAWPQPVYLSWSQWSQLVSHKVKL